MWTFLEVARIEQIWGEWQALVTLVRLGVPESFFLSFLSEPTLGNAQAAGQTLATLKNDLAAAAELAALVGVPSAP